MALIKFTPDRVPRRGDPNAAMTLWQIILSLVDWVNSAIINNYKAGSTSVTSGNTSVIVSHGLGIAAYRTAVVPTIDPGGRWWISNKTATQFQLNLSVAAPVGGISFDWLVKGD